MKSDRKLKMWIAAAAVFGLSCSFSCWVLSGVNIYSLPVIEKTSLGSYNEKVPAGKENKEAIIVIDAGHGGMDGGASAADGTLEKDLTLSIAEKLEKTAAEYPVKVIMTRTDDSGIYTDDDRPVRTRKREDLLNRKNIIENSGADVAVSIHLNSFPQDASVYGAQVFYPSGQTERTDVRDEKRTSRGFAESVQKALEINIPDGKERTAMAKDDILLFRDTEAAVILVECGFLSNEKEAALLKTAEYQQLLADAVWQGINEILYLKKTQKLQIIYSTNTKP